MRGAEAVSRYVALPRQEAFDIEYWQLEEAKLRRMPPEKELSRRVSVVVGAGSGIGREVALRLAREGSHVACADVDAESAQAIAAEVTKKHGPAVGLACDVTRRESVRAMLDQVALAYGGFDAVVVTAGVFVPADTSGRIPDEKWGITFAVNVAGGYLVADEAGKTFREQGLPGAVVLTTSANAVVPKKGSVAYDCSKAAASHLVRELAVELAPLVRVNGVAPATVVQGSAMFPRDRVLGSLAKYGIEYGDGEPTEALVARLAAFYADRTLTKAPVTPADQAEAVFLLVGDRLSKTTGQIVAVDGGLHEAFLR
jgi:NAD(P)-dependent dehydrogenase (short-subunit alcohol dehydrogenase family)